MRSHPLTLHRRPDSWRRSARAWMGVALATLAIAWPTQAAESIEPKFASDVRPLLTEFCGDCHADGAKKGGVSFDEFPSEAAAMGDPALWLSVLKNVRAGLMPPAKKPQPSAEQKQRLEIWIKQQVFHSDPKDPDPGRVTLRRLNRTEYRNTIRDLVGVEYDTQMEFPADDSGQGFDNLGEVLTVSPMLLEKYLVAAKSIIDRAVPAVSALPAEVVMPGRQFHRDPATPAVSQVAGSGSGTLIFSYYDVGRASHPLTLSQGGRFQVLLDLSTTERYVDNQFDYNQCRVVVRMDGQEVWSKAFTREGTRSFQFQTNTTWAAGEHRIEFEVQPMAPAQKQVRSLGVRLDSLTVRGPLDRKQWVLPANYTRFFPKTPPADSAGRRRYARELLESFASRAFRQPVDSPSVDRLVALAEATYRDGHHTFEAGIQQAMVAILASPRFLFREEFTEHRIPSGRYPLVDQYALASRLSYFLWSTMPDRELMDLAASGQLRGRLAAQVQRMMRDDRFEGFLQNFVGQWLQTRDVENVPIEARQVLAREAIPDPAMEARFERFRALRQRTESDLTVAERKELEEIRPFIIRRNREPLRAELTGDLRRAMRQETEKTFGYVVREDRPLRELLQADYTFLNERLAKYYGLTNLPVQITGDEMRRVQLPPGNPRGGILTQGTVLAVTSNPTRTSPVKRGLFVLDNILGTPPPPPPPNVTPLEDAAKRSNQTPSLRAMLALHREKPLCSGCHNRMDPLGLALENFNAMGLWRDQERGQPVDTSGVLLTGESFSGIQELKQILSTRHAPEFYRTLTEKLLTYALGRGLRETDVETVDQIVAAVLRDGGKPSTLFTGITTSAPFLKTNPAARTGPKSAPATTPSTAPNPSRQRADARLPISP